MAKRESIDSMAGIPDSTQDTAGKDDTVQEVQETPAAREVHEAGREPQPTGQAKKYLELHSKFTSNMLDIIAGRMLAIPWYSKGLDEDAKEIGMDAKQMVEGMLKTTVSAFARGWPVPGYSPEINLSGSLSGDNPGEVFGNSLYVRLFNSLKSAARENRAVKEEKAKAAGKDLPGETDNTRQILSKAATDYFFLVNYEKLRPMDGGKLTKTRQEEAGKYYKRIKKYAADNSIGDIEKALYPKGILWDDTQLPKATPEYLQFIFEFSESESKKAADRKSAAEQKREFEKIFEKLYMITSASKGLGLLAEIRPLRSGQYFEYDTITGVKKITNKELTLYIPGDADIFYSTGCQKLLDVLIILLINQNNSNGKNINPTVQIELDSYIRLTGKDPAKKTTLDKARREINKYLAVLRKSEYVYKTSDWQFLSHKTIENGIIRANFDVDVAKNLLKNRKSYINLNLLKIDDRNKYAYAVGRELCMQYGMSNNASRVKDGYMLISVQALTRHFFGLPTYEEIHAKNRHYYDFIILPVINTLDCLKESHLIDYEFCNAGHSQLTEFQKKHMDDYNTFISLYVRFKWLDFPCEIPVPIPEKK